MDQVITKFQKLTLSWRYYLALCKPRVLLLIVFTAMVGQLLASTDETRWTLILFSTLGIGLAAAAGAAINHWADRRVDAVMARTRNRPLPQSEISPRSALVFALVIASLSMAILFVEVNLLTTVLTFLSMVGYSVIYTLYLKYATPHNIVLGGASGAAPPLLGWTAVTGEVGVEAVILFLIVFLWTPPHFWALAIKRREEYAKAKIPMLPVTHGVAHTKRQILVYTLLLTGITLLPFLIGMSGILYLTGSMVLGARFIWYAVKLKTGGDDDFAGKTFKFSILYLSLMFGLLLLDHYLQLVVIS